MFFFMSNFIETLKNFWEKHPALAYGLVMLIGCNLAFSGNLLLLIPIMILLVTIRGLANAALLIVLTAASFLFAHYSYQLPSLPEEGIEGTGIIQITSTVNKTNHFGKQAVFKGFIQTFENTDHQVIGKNLPYTLSIPNNESNKIPKADKNYQISGRLKQLASGYYTITKFKEAPLIPVEGSFSLAEFRKAAKQKVTDYIHRQYEGSRASVFLAGIATGDFDDRSMVYEFGRFGLQHIMAISGFHFAIIAGIFSLLLRFVFNQRTAAIVLIFLLSSYYLFLGSASSIMRAWVTILIALLSTVFKKRSNGLNSLGIALIFILLIDPLLSRSLGFQFSFAATAAILILFPLSDQLLQSFLKKRYLSNLVQMDFLNQHGYCFLVFCRQAIALSLAVTLVTLPITLYYFQKFPIMSLIYNLFFPFMVSISMLLLILGLLLPFAGSLIHQLNQIYTEFSLNLIYNIPPSLDIYYRANFFSLELVLIYLYAVFCISIYAKERLGNDEETFAFL